jgi:hypothetical protein
MWHAPINGILVVFMQLDASRNVPSPPADMMAVGHSVFFSL